MQVERKFATIHSNSAMWHQHWAICRDGHYKCDSRLATYMPRQPGVQPRNMSLAGEPGTCHELYNHERCLAPCRWSACSASLLPSTVRWRSSRRRSPQSHRCPRRCAPLCPPPSMSQSPSPRHAPQQAPAAGVQYHLTVWNTDAASRGSTVLAMVLEACQGCMTESISQVFI